MNSSVQLKHLLAIFILTCNVTLAVDIAHFYRATPFWTEPRFERAWLTTFDVAVGHRSTCKGRDKFGTETELLDIYGLHNMHLLGSNLCNKDLTNTEDLILHNLTLLTRNSTFGQFSFSGVFDLTETNIDILQNFNCGFFSHLHIPVRSISIDCITRTDLTPTTGCSPNASHPTWQAFLNSFDAILDRYDLSIAPVKCRGIGDTSFMLGWTQNYEDTKHLDFVDTTIRLGALIPTGRRKNEDLVFDIPPGNNKHPGAVLALDMSVGIYNWLTFGTHFHTILFGDKKRILRMKTDIEQKGFIKLSKGCATVSKGKIWDAGVYVQVDHVCYGISLLAGYTFATQYKDFITPDDTDIFSPSAANSDLSLAGWNMHTFHIMAEIDFAQDSCTYGPRIGFFYDRHVGGRQIFQTNMIGASAGIHIAWDI